MRRKDREVLDVVCINQIIEKCDCCRLGLIDGDRPYIVPLNFGHVYEDEKLVFYFHGANEGHKIELIHRNKYAGFEMDTAHMLHGQEKACNHTFFYQSIIGTGKISFVTDKQKKIEALQLIMKHYTKKDNWDFEGKMVENMAVIRLEVESMTCKENRL